MLKYRLILGPIMIAYLLGVLWLDEWFTEEGKTREGLLLLVLLVLPGIRLAAREVAAMFRAKRVPTDFRVLFIAGALGAVGVYAVMHEAPAMLVPSLAVASLMHAVIAKWRRQRTEQSMHAAAATMFCFVYLGLMPGMMLAIRIEHTVWVLAAALLITKSCDIGAYFAGRAFGRHKLIYWLSPGKTWEGLGGGLVLSALVALATLTPESMSDLHWAYALLVGIVLGAVGQAGDLLESMLKRDADIKDSGASIPGFGGVLDVFDSPLLAGPVAYWLLALAG